MDLQLQFVDSISASATVRLDFDTAPWSTQVGTRFDPPEMKYAVADTLLNDGERLAASAYRDRMIVLRLRLLDVTEDEAAAQMQLLFRELNRPSNFLRYQPGTTEPVWFRTKRCSADAVDFDPVEKTVTVQVPAEPFAYGLKESLPSVTVSNDPYGKPMNANPFFETDVSSWSAVGGTVVRTLLQFHQGLASLLLTPDGVTANTRAVSESVPATPGVTYRLSAWLRCAVSRNVNLQSIFFDAGAVSLGTTTTPVALTANVWTFADMTVTAPPTTATGILRVEMTSTPPAGHTLHIDEAMLRDPAVHGQAIDIDNVKGDVDTPCIVRLPGATVTDAFSLVSVRHRDLTGLHYAFQCESMAVATDTTVQPNDPAMSGPGSNFVRTTFATQPLMVNRLTWGQWPPDPSHARYRGKYRLLLRYRKSGATDVIRVRVRWGGTGSTDSLVGDTVTLSDNGAVGHNIHWADLGVFALPPSPDPIYDGFSGTALPVSGVAFAIQAERVSGAGNLDMDVLVAVPADEDFCYVNWKTVLGTFPALATLDGVWRMAYGQEADLTIPDHTGCAVVGTFPTLRPGVANRMYVIPNVSVLNPADSLSTAMPVTVDYWPRYLQVRPVST